MTEFIAKIFASAALLISLTVLIAHIAKRRRACKLRVIITAAAVLLASSAYFVWFFMPFTVPVDDNIVLQICYENNDGSDILRFVGYNDDVSVRGLVENLSVRRLYSTGGGEFYPNMGGVRADDFIRIYVWKGVLNSDKTDVDGAVIGRYVLFRSQPDKSVYIPFTGGYINKCCVTKDSASIVEELCQLLKAY